MKRLAALLTGLLLTTTLWNPSADAAAFPDVHPNEKAYEAVEEMASRGLIAGFPDGTFRQNDPVTRAQNTIFLGRVQGIDGYPNARLPYSDVAPGQAAFPYIAYYASQNVFELGNRFYPDTIVTRAELARTVVRALRLSGTPDVPFTDVPASHPYASYINALAANGLTNGVGNNRYDPNGIVTRGQMAIFMLNIDDFLGTDENPGYTIDPSFVPSAIEREIGQLVNEERANQGLAPVTLANDVSFVARTKSKDMHDRGYFDHTSPTYGSPFDMLTDFGLRYSTAGENIASGYVDAEAVMEGWMNSPGHRRNILNPQFKEIGVGVYNRYYTQMFVTR
ncbi:S-layer homology domain-containing protein [Domibacillus robiginosus]|uniref:S-layer homology domain-containing protein n=1 Tax=Domibacillus robiginosus TaxID=1071054 RepID=UPI00067B5C4D|nr:S-layer homology domain-containing protein [Domibacillus robiginosus]